MDFQTILVLLVILAAAVYIGQRAVNRLRAFSSSGEGCDTGCGKCGSAIADAKQSKFAKL